jgi:hypothetical protein
VRCLGIVGFQTVHRHFNRSWRFIDAYQRGLTGTAAEWAVKKKKQHCNFSGTSDYQVNKSQYTLLLRILHDLGRLATVLFLFSGKTPPALASWTDEADVLDTYMSPAFEIAAVCFCIEVEDHPWVLNKYYDFVQGKPPDHDVETISAANDFARSACSDHSVVQHLGDMSSISNAGFISKTNALTNYPLRRASTIRFGSSAPNYGLPPNNRRMGEVLTLLAPIFEAARDYLGGALPVEPRHLRMHVNQH